MFKRKFLTITSILATVLTMAMVTTSCKKDKEYETPIVSITPNFENNTIQFTKEGEQKSLTINSNRKWNAELKGDNTDWLSINPRSGETGETTITITALQNKQEAAREAQLTITASSKTFVYNLVQAGTSGQTIEYVPLSKLAEMGKDLTKDNPLTIEEDLRIQATVTSNYEDGQFVFKGFHYIQDKDGNAIVLTVPKGNEAYKFGTKFTARLKGCTLTNYNGTIQVQVPNDVTTILGNEPLTPKTVTIQDILDGKCINQFVKLEAVQFEKTGVVFFEGDYSTKRHTVINQSGQKVTLEVWKNASFKDETVPENSGSITAIATINRSSKGKTYYNLRPSLRSDIQLNQPRFEVGGNVNPVGNFTPLSTIVEMANGLGHKETKEITDELYIKATVVSDGNGKQFPFQGYHHIIDKDNNGMVLTVPKGDDAYNFGDVLIASLKGTTLTNYGGTIQVQVPNGNIKVDGNNPLQPQEITISELLEGKHINHYVKINNVQFETPGGIFSDGANYVTRHNIVDKQNNKATVEIWKYATFKSETVPSESGSIVAIATINVTKDGKTYYNLRPSLRTDIKFNQPRFNNGGGDNPTPDPDPDPMPGEASLLFPSADFENWDAFLGCLNKYGLKDYISKAEGKGRDNSTALHVNGNSGKKNEYLFTVNVTDTNILDNKSKISFYIKGIANSRSMSINLYKADNSYYAFNLGDCSGDMTLETSGSNQYTGTIDTQNKWVKVTLNIAGLTNLTNIADSKLIAFKVGKGVAWDMLIDDITIE